MLLGGTGTWHFTTHGQPIGKTGLKNRERKATQGDGMIYKRGQIFD